MTPLELAIPTAHVQSTHAHLYRSGHQALIVLVHGEETEQPEEFMAAVTSWFAETLG